MIPELPILEPMTREEWVQWRDRLDLTLREAAQLLGYSPRQIRNWEHGRTRPPRKVRWAMIGITYYIAVNGYHDAMRQVWPPGETYPGDPQF